MLKDITLGQFFPGNSLIHRADARFKIILLLIYLTLTLSANTVISLAIVLLLTFVLILLTKIPFSVVMRNMRPLFFVLLFTAVINVFWTEGSEEGLLVAWKFIRIYKEGLIQAGLMTVRLLCLVSGSFIILTYTTSPVELTDALERLLSPLKVIKVPVHEFAMMMSIALRFIPTLIEETDKIISAQRSRGTDFESGNIIHRAKAIIPILIPLFVSAFRRAGDLALAMECRCYRGGEGRTRMKTMKAHFYDYLLVCAMLTICVSVICYFNPLSLEVIGV